MNSNRKIRVELVFIVLGILAIAILLSIFNFNVEKNVENEMQSYLEEIRDNAIYVLNNEIEYFTNYLSIGAHALSHLQNASDQALLAELQSFPTNPAMARILIMTNQGVVYSALDGIVGEFDPEDFKEDFARESAYIKKPRYSQTMDKIVVAIVQPLFLNGKRSGVLVGEYDIAYFEKIFSKNFLDGDCAINLAAANGQRISRSAEREAPTHFKDDIFEFYFRDDVHFIKNSAADMKSDMEAGLSGYSSYKTEGIIRYVSYAPVGINDWYVAAVSTERTLAAQTSVIRESAFQLALGIVVAMLAMAAAVFIVRAKEERAVQDFLKKTARTDPLTKLYNKSATANAIDAFLKGPGATGHHALLMMDIDGFKLVNDLLGHLKGDEILEEFGETLHNVFRNDDIVGRVGGDEFVAFMKNCGNEEKIAAKAQEVCRLVRKTHFSDKTQTVKAETAVSIGIALYDKDGRDFATLYRNADLALYDSKNNGRNRHSFHQSAAKE